MNGGDERRFAAGLNLSGSSYDLTNMDRGELYEDSNSFYINQYPQPNQKNSQQEDLPSPRSFLRKDQPNVLQDEHSYVIDCENIQNQSSMSQSAEIQKKLIIARKSQNSLSKEAESESVTQEIPDEIQEGARRSMVRGGQNQARRISPPSKNCETDETGLDLLQLQQQNMFIQDQQENYNQQLNHFPVSTLGQSNKEHRNSENTQLRQRSFQSMIIRTTLVSSDSLVEVKGLRELERNPEVMKHHMMTRVNWIAYLKILYDQLEKIKCYQDQQPETQVTSFLRIKRKEAEAMGRPIEKVNRDQFVSALSKIMSLLPLMTQEEHTSRYPQEQAITFIDVHNKLMSSSLRELTWDNIIDMLLMISLDRKQGSFAHAEDQGARGGKQGDENGSRTDQRPTFEDEEAEDSSKLANFIKSKKIGNPQPLLRAACGPKRDSTGGFDSRGDQPHESQKEASPTPTYPVVSYPRAKAQLQSESPDLRGAKQRGPEAAADRRMSLHKDSQVSSQVVIEDDSSSENSQREKQDQMDMNGYGSRSRRGNFAGLGAAQNHPVGLRSSMRGIGPTHIGDRVAPENNELTSQLIQEERKLSPAVPGANVGIPLAGSARNSLEDGSYTIWQKSEVSDLNPMSSRIPHQKAKPNQSRIIPQRTESPDFQAKYERRGQTTKIQGSTEYSQNNQNAIMTGVSFGNKDKMMAEFQRQSNGGNWVGRQTEKLGGNYETGFQSNNQKQILQIEKQIQSKIDFQYREDLDEFLKNQQVEGQNEIGKMEQIQEVSGNGINEFTFKQVHKNAANEAHLQQNQHNHAAVQSIIQIQRTNGEQQSIEGGRQTAAFRATNDLEAGAAFGGPEAIPPAIIHGNQQAQRPVVQTINSRNMPDQKMCHPPKVVYNQSVDTKDCLNEAINLIQPQNQNGQPPNRRTEKCDSTSTGYVVLRNRISGYPSKTATHSRRQSKSILSGKSRKSSICDPVQLHLAGIDFQLVRNNLKGNIQCLNVCSCQLKSLDVILKTCRNLKFLNASDNHLRAIVGNQQSISGSTSQASSQRGGTFGKKMKSAKKEQFKLPFSLEELILANNNLSNIQSLKFEQPEAEQKLKHLNILDISNNQISNLQNLATFIKNNSNDKYGIGYNNNRGFRISYLCIQGNKFDINSPNPLVQKIAQKATYDNLFPPHLKVINKQEILAKSTFKSALRLDYYRSDPIQERTEEPSKSYTNSQGRKRVFSPATKSINSNSRSQGKQTQLQASKSQGTVGTQATAGRKPRQPKNLRHIDRIQHEGLEEIAVPKGGWKTAKNSFALPEKSKTSYGDPSQALAQFRQMDLHRPSNQTMRRTNSNNFMSLKQINHQIQTKPNTPTLRQAALKSARVSANTLQPPSQPQYPVAPTQRVGGVQARDPPEQKPPNEQKSMSPVAQVHHVPPSKIGLKSNSKGFQETSAAGRKGTRVPTQRTTPHTTADGGQTFSPQSLRAVLRGPPKANPPSAQPVQPSNFASPASPMTRQQRTMHIPDQEMGQNSRNQIQHQSPRSFNPPKAAHYQPLKVSGPLPFSPKQTLKNPIQIQKQGKMSSAQNPTNRGSFHREPQIQQPAKASQPLQPMIPEEHDQDSMPSWPTDMSHDDD